LAVPDLLFACACLALCLLLIFRAVRPDTWSPRLRRFLALFLAICGLMFLLQVAAPYLAEQLVWAGKLFGAGAASLLVLLLLTPVRQQPEAPPAAGYLPPPEKDGRDAVGSLLPATNDGLDHEPLQEQLVQAQKLEVLGRLTGGIAHDLNNILTIVLGCSEALLHGRHPGESPRDLVEHILQAGERAARLTRQLLAFSRKQAHAPCVLNLNTVVRELARMLQRLIGEDVELALNLEVGLPGVKADPNQVDQVLLNLCVNARDAMPAGGRLTIGTRTILPGSTDAPPAVQQGAARHVLLEVSDTGCGMDERTRARLFEPFFTTKEAGKGTGLGLAIVHDAVMQAGGHITVSSQPGRGATFRIYLRAEEGTAEVPVVGRGPAARPGAGETVLLAEDDNDLRPLIRKMLVQAGYTILEARDGAEAVRLCEGHPGPLHLLLTDVFMPTMNGPELAGRLRQARPNLKVLYTSGYPAEAVLRHGVPDLEAAFLRKPFTPAALLTRVREALGAPLEQDGQGQEGMSDRLTCSESR
jgi:two-component system cell cycle sensor histidine kinase/response regulator CckA